MRSYVTSALVDVQKLELWHRHLDHDLGGDSLELRDALVASGPEACMGMRSFIMNKHVHRPSLRPKLHLPGCALANLCEGS